MVYEVTAPDHVEKLFGNWPESLIWSCLQGIMGRMYAVGGQSPVSVMAVLGDFLYFAGRPDMELVSFKPDWYKQDFVIMVPQDDAWGALIEQKYEKKAAPVIRYAIKKDSADFDRKKLQQVAAGLPGGYEIHLIDEKYYKMCREEKWSSDFVIHFENYDMFRKLGLGVVITEGNRIVSGASSYSRYLEGIEVEIATREEYRRKGLAYVCGAKLILECMERNLYPSWDARNLWSVSLAEKLGYHFSHEYKAYEIRGY